MESHAQIKSSYRTEIRDFCCWLKLTSPVNKWIFLGNFRCFFFSCVFLNRNDRIKHTWWEARNGCLFVCTPTKEDVLFSFLKLHSFSSFNSLYVNIEFWIWIFEGIKKQAGVSNKTVTHRNRVCITHIFYTINIINKLAKLIATVKDFSSSCFTNSRVLLQIMVLIRRFVTINQIIETYFEDSRRLPKYQHKWANTISALNTKSSPYKIYIFCPINCSQENWASDRIASDRLSSWKRQNLLTTTRNKTNTRHKCNTNVSLANHSP